MKTTKKTRGVAVLVLGIMVSSLAQAEQKEQGKYLPRSVYMPVEFTLCEHLGGAVFYENDQPIAAMPASRIFQFTYYPDLEAMLPEQIRVRIEGKYTEDGEPFVAKLAVTVDGVHSAHRFRAAGTSEQIRKQSHRVDIRLKPKSLKMACPRFCKKRVTTVASNETHQN